MANQPIQSKTRTCLVLKPHHISKKGSKTTEVKATDLVQNHSEFGQCFEKKNDDHGKKNDINNIYIYTYYYPHDLQSIFDVCSVWYLILSDSSHLFCS